MQSANLCNGYSSSNRYSIKHPKEGMHHAIFQISIKRSIGGKTGYSTCTAFAISDKTALTAGHCVMSTEEFVKNQYPNLLKKSIIKVRKMNMELNRLARCFSLKCEARYKYLEDEIDKEIETREILEKADEFTVTNIYGEDTKIKATAVKSDYNMRDHAILRGDFKKFEKLNVRKNFDIKRGDILRTCGYAGGRKPPICTDFIAIGNYNFMYKGRGFMIKGMSGGPVIDRYGLVVGINSAVSTDLMFIDTLVGVFNLKMERPKKKIQEPIKLRAKNR